MKMTAILAGAFACSAALAVAVLASSGNDVGEESSTLAGVTAGMHFTDAEGNARLPTAEERAALAQAFQADLANLTGKRRIPTGSSRAASGAEKAVVGADKLRFLVVDDSGTVTYDHSGIDADGRIEAASANPMPEM